MVDDSAGRPRSSQVPRPPHPHERRQPLPGHRPKPHEDDAFAPKAVETILASYREADLDTDFLQQDVTRGVRLQIDYLKTETLLEQHDVAHTIVVFGSTRIPEPQAAGREVEACAKALAASPQDSALQRRLAIAERIQAKSRYYDIAREFGRIVGAAGAKALGGRIMIVTGVGPVSWRRQTAEPATLGPSRLALTSACQGNSTPTLM